MHRSGKVEHGANNMDISTLAAPETVRRTYADACRGRGACPSGSQPDVDLSHLPLDVQLHILACIPLAELARLAPLGKTTHTLYKKRLEERQTCIQGRLAEGWPTEVTEKLSEADMAVPCDFIDTPPIPDRLQCLPELNNERVSLDTDWGGLRPGKYRGFALRGKPYGRGEWVSDDGTHTYAGEWYLGVPDGFGKEITPSGYTYRGNFRDGMWNGLGELQHTSGMPMDGRPRCTGLHWFVHGQCTCDDCLEELYPL